MPKISVYDLDKLSDEPVSEKIRTRQNREQKSGAVKEKKSRGKREKQIEFFEEDDF